MVNSIDFESWVKFITKNLFDFAALETHPLTAVLVRPPEQFSGGRGEYLRKLVAEATEQLRPPGRETSPVQPEWRPYFILRERYVEGRSLNEISSALAIGDRQLRREHHRALEALTLRLWKLFESSTAEADEPAAAVEAHTPFEVNIQRTDPAEILRGIRVLLQQRAQEENRTLFIEGGEGLAAIQTDRVILRQILISLATRGLRNPDGGPLRITVQNAGPELVFDIDFLQSEMDLGFEDLLDTVRFWARNINARFEFSHAAGRIHFLLALPKADQRIILIVDDQEPAISLFRRYLARTDFQVAGETDPAQALQTAHRLRPALITLDVMMPHVDGWELLQMFKSTEATRNIPVLVCSAWEEPELARSLGAAGFLKKPVTQKMFLDELIRLDILDS